MYAIISNSLADCRIFNCCCTERTYSLQHYCSCLPCEYIIDQQSIQAYSDKL